ncbi:asparagine synthase (glutamine-hydrolyzing) [Desulfonatronum thiodismutans]|uniref:asparagine synthase (glutamine-hydrolyzing) n=1 Tax=Desulfonatronum thiodismutans TaxID=159290 RepID=UPI00068FFD1B|nr:asparagine synthase (glutamine-hydrolyzing) [Desulfonatronum thiodismutans]
MCGIVGFASHKPLLEHDTLVAMRDTLVHRGPDDAGVMIWNASGKQCRHEPGVVGLGHRRLSIIDLSQAGRQPMSNETGDVWITYNGEFYNFSEYRKELAKRHGFASNSDTETIIHLFEDYGISGTLERMNGMFAFALWDVASKTMYLARDRLGKKPLYYSHQPDGTLIFASEIKALLQSGMVDQARIDPIALIQFWTYGYVIGERTVFEQIKRLLPGHHATWRDGELSIREYWDCPFGVDVFTGRSLDDLAEELEELLCDAIRLRMVADVPVGLFLSGGVDSSLVAALVAKAAGRSVNSYTIGFTDQAYDESAQAAEISGRLGLSNTMLAVTDEMEPSFAAIVRQFDEPFGHKSAIPTYFVAKLAKEHVSVALTGDGGDELFGGYDFYAKALSLWGDSEQRKFFSKPGTLLQKVSDLWFRHVLKKQKLTVLEMLVSPRNLRKLLCQEVWEGVRGKSWYGDREQWYARVAVADVLSQFQYVNLKTYLPDGVLVKVDRMSMAHALECRSPILDHRVVSFAARLPYWAKIDGQGRRKSILKHILRKYLPEHLVDLPKKGFSPPWDQWCRGPLGMHLKNSWLRQDNGYQNPAAAALLFPGRGVGSDTLQWNAFSSLHFFRAFS